MLVTKKMNMILSMLLDLFDQKKEDDSKFITYLVFEPASLRIPDNDLLLVGDQVIDLFTKVMEKASLETSLEDQILLNRLTRIEMMTDLLKSNNGLIMTKFLNKIWKRHAFFSHLGELFITKGDLDRFAPDYKFSEPLVLKKIRDMMRLQNVFIVIRTLCRII